jgi:hypothetical protein
MLDQEVLAEARYMVPEVMDRPLELAASVPSTPPPLVEQQVPGVVEVVDIANILSMAAPVVSMVVVVAVCLVMLTLLSTPVPALRESSF